MLSTISILIETEKKNSHGFTTATKYAAGTILATITAKKLYDWYKARKRKKMAKYTGIVSKDETNPFLKEPSKEEKELSVALGYENY